MLIESARAGRWLY
ncbi:hypothetical protein C1N78_24695 (plasmid) [Serratia marcescens]|nr:hypothetical protein C1N78_24695 [Serratia marcescens]